MSAPAAAKAVAGPDLGVLYDEVRYPTNVVPQATPDRMAVLARAGGRSPADVRTARVLEVGCSDGINLLSLAAAAPDAHYLGIDLSAVAIERGRKWRDAAGLTSVRLEVMDLIDAVDALEGPFDYIIAHGVFAWVPQHVREALFALIGRHLAPEGVAHVSFNTLPGGHFRRIIRDILLHEIAPITDPEAQRRQAVAVLKGLGGSEETDNVFQMAIRKTASGRSSTLADSLFHDELSPYWEPMSLTDAVELAGRHGVAFLNDLTPGLMQNGFRRDIPAASEKERERELLRELQRSDFIGVRFFRNAIWVRDDGRPRGVLDLDVVGELYASASGKRIGDGEYELRDGTFSVEDDQLKAAMDALIAADPARLRVADIAPGPGHVQALFRLFDSEGIGLHTVDAPFATSLPERPTASPLTRTLIADGLPAVCRLDHHAIAMPDPEPRRLLMLADGTRSLEELIADAAAEGLGTPNTLRPALEALMRSALMVRTGT